MKKEHLLHFFPFLKKEFRQIVKEEIKSEETFKELFQNEVFDSHKLKAVYEYQSAGGKFKQPKAKKNGKV